MLSLTRGADVKIEKMGPEVYRITNNDELEAVVMHGRELPTKDILSPGMSWEFSAPVEVRYGPFLPDPGLSPKPVVVMNEAVGGPTMFRATMRAWRYLEENLKGEPLTLSLFNAAIMQFLSGMAGLPDPNAPGFKPQVVPKNGGSEGES
jgi:hypothetical protein